MCLCVVNNPSTHAFSRILGSRGTVISGPFGMCAPPYISLAFIVQGSLCTTLFLLPATVKRLAFSVRYQIPEGDLTVTGTPLTPWI